jgi:hypothetical protein
METEGDIGERMSRICLTNFNFGINAPRRFVHDTLCIYEPTSLLIKGYMWNLSGGKDPFNLIQSQVLGRVKNQHT